MSKKLMKQMALAVVLASAGVLAFLLATGERGLGLSSSARPPFEPRPVVIELLGADAAADLGWNHKGLEAAFDYAARLSTDTLLIVTDGEVVGVLGDPATVLPVHSVRKALLSTLIGQRLGEGPDQISLSSTLEELGIDDQPQSLTPGQKQATVQHLLNNVSGINHAAAAEAGLTAEKMRRLGSEENEPGRVWAYNNWDHNALSTIYEERTEQPIATAFHQAIAEPLGLQDFKPEHVTYIEEPDLSQHRAASFKMSGRDLVTLGELYLHKGEVEGSQVLPSAWVEQISKGLVETEIEGLRAGYSAMWWIPGPETGLPAGTFWGWGLGNQALLVVPAWRTVIVHQANTAALVQRAIALAEEKDLALGEAILELALSCREPEKLDSDFCIEERFILRGEFAGLITGIAAARL